MAKMDQVQVDEELERTSRDELHRKWLEQQDVAATDEILNKISYCWGTKKQVLASAFHEDDDMEDTLEIHHDTDDRSEQQHDRDGPEGDAIARAEECDTPAQGEEDEDKGEEISDDEDWKERILRRQKLEELEKLEEFTPPELDESSQEIMILMNRASTAQPPKFKPTGGGHMSLFGHNSRSISRQSSFMSMKASNSFGGGVRTTGASSYVFSRDDGNSRDRALQKDSQEDSQTSDQCVQGSKPGFLAAAGAEQPKQDMSGRADARGGVKRKAQPNGALSLFGLLKRQTTLQAFDSSAGSSVLEEGISLFAAVNSIKPIRQGRGF